MAKVIKKILTKQGDIYQVGQNYERWDGDGFAVCAGISHRIDGEAGIFKDKGIDEARYEVLLVDEQGENEPECIVVPQRETTRITYVIEKKAKKKDGEQAVEMEAN